MEVRECKPNDVISLLQCARDDKDILFLDNWTQYQRWLLDAVYNTKWQVLVADDGFGVVGFLVWNLFQESYKWVGYLNYVYVHPDFRGKGAADNLVLQFIRNIYNSSAQRLKFNTMVLPAEWVDVISMNAPHEKYTTYYFERTEEIKRWYNENLRENSN